MDEQKKDDGTLPPATEQEIVLDGEKIGGHFIKPWTIRKCAGITPILELIHGSLKKRRLTFRDFVILEKQPDGKNKVTVTNLDQLFFCVTPYAPALIEKTLDITPEELDKIKPDDMLPIIVCILRQNVGYIKNSLALMTSMVQTVAKLSA
jgi:hypothetical protein